jgi:hypothetical protein
MLVMTTLERQPAVEELFDDTGRVDFNAVSEATGEPIARLAQLTPITPDALRKNPTSDRAQEGARRFVLLLAQLTRLLGSRKAALIWLRSENAELENAAPMQLLYARNFEPVEALVRDALSGSPG